LHAKVTGSLVDIALLGRFFALLLQALWFCFAVHFVCFLVLLLLVHFSGLDIFVRCYQSLEWYCPAFCNAPFHQLKCYIKKKKKHYRLLLFKTLLFKN
jgi:hypothetical protein